MQTQLLRRTGDRPRKFLFHRSTGRTINLKVPGNAPASALLQAVTRRGGKHRLPAVASDFLGRTLPANRQFCAPSSAAAAFARESFDLARWRAYSFVCSPSCVKIGGESQPLSSSTLTDNSQQISRAAIFRYELRIAHGQDTPSRRSCPPKPWPLNPCLTRPRENSVASTSARDKNLALARNLIFLRTILEIQSVRSNASVVSTMAQLNHKLSTHFRDF